MEFGGGRFLNKNETQVRRVSLECFEHGVASEVVTHPITWMGLQYLPLLPPEEVVDRAEWLYHEQPPEYQLGFRNCESIAVWCATGAYETFQVKALMGALALTSVGGLLVSRRWPRLGKGLSIANVGASLLTAVPYIHNRAFFDHTRRYPGRGNWLSPRM